MAAEPKTRSSTPRLSEIARHVKIPSGIVSTGWTPVKNRCATFGIGFDAWQEGLGALALAKRSDGMYAAGIGGVVLSIPRQVGKTYLIGWIVFALCTIVPSLTVIWTAHRTRTSNETFEKMRTMSRRPKVAGHIQGVRATNGEQAINFKNGSRILFGAREAGFGRGFAEVDILVLDEAQILTENAMSDMEPATNAAANGLVIMMGTPPRPKDPGEVFAHRRAEALAGDEDTLYVEFSSDEGVNPATWKKSHVDWKQVSKANPSYPHRTSRTAILRMRKLLASDDAFRREALGIWDKEAKQAAAIPADKWLECLVDVDVDTYPSQCFAVRFSVDGSHVALAAASRVDRRRILVDGVRVEAAAAGVEWAISFLTEADRLARTAQIVVDGKGGTGYLIDQLRAAGVPQRLIWTPSTDQVITAHSMFLEGVKTGRVAHWESPELDREVGWATLRKIGAQGGFGWLAPDGQTVALLDAATLAHWAVRTTKRRPKGTQRKAVRVL
ncbi:terminase [Actinomyces culturomici]|uniref:terminase n=1 Tax=Actinomyces culturomici TaxID=1926276 RepID=UPI000E20BC4B|nr:terminase [Actinomyces culturomici]